MQYPENYLHVLEPRSGETWIVPLADDDLLDLQTQVERWIASRFDGELVLDGDLTPRLSGEYYAKLMTDRRPPESVVCWESGGFYLKSPE